LRRQGDSSAERSLYIKSDKSGASTTSITWRHRGKAKMKKEKKKKS
jgi:hypothetical protein